MLCLKIKMKFHLNINSERSDGAMKNIKLWISVIVLFAAIAVIFAGCGGSSGQQVFTPTTPITPTIPTPPTGVSALPGNGQLTIAWTAVAGATSYNIYWSATSGVTTANGTKITGAS